MFSMNMMSIDKLWPVGVNPDNYPEFISKSSEHIVRKGKDMSGYFMEEAEPDTLLYEVFEAESEGHIKLALTVMPPGKVGNEFFMTKGHFHQDDKAGEVYVGIKGQGMVIMQTKCGRTNELPIGPGAVVYIPPGWAHRTINTGNEEFIMMAIFPETSGHDYGSIQDKGFIKRVIEQDGQVQVV